MLAIRLSEIFWIWKRKLAGVQAQYWLRGCNCHLGVAQGSAFLSEDVTTIEGKRAM